MVAGLGNITQSLTVEEINRKRNNTLSGTGTTADNVKFIAKNHDKLKGSESLSKYLKSIADNVKKKTNNFSDPGNLSDEKIELKSLLFKHKIAPGEWLRDGRSLERSETDVVAWLANAMHEYLNTTDKAEDDTGEKERIRIAEAEAEALMLMIELEEEEQNY